MSNNQADSKVSIGPRRRFQFRLLTLFIVITLVCIACAYVYWVRTRHVATASALVLIDSHPTYVIGGDSHQFDPHEYDIFRTTQISLLKSKVLIEPCLKVPQVLNSSLLANRTDRAEWLSRQIEVDVNETSEVISIRLRGTASQATELKAVVDAIVVEYLKLQRADSMERNQIRAEILRSERERLESNLVSLFRRVEQIKLKDDKAVDLKFAEMELAIVSERYKELAKEIGTMQTNSRSPARVKLLQAATVSYD